MNYFGYATAAERYANSRPFFPPLAARKIRTVCCDGARVARALDIGCGTGQSSVALLEVADEIVGVDRSPSMLSQAIRHERVRYVESGAEQLPFDDESFGLVTVACAFHWFDRRQFVPEVRRVLQVGGWLVIYNDGFCGRMVGNPDYEAWNREGYLTRYRTPPRGDHFLSDSDALAFGFVPRGVEQFVHDVQFTPEQLVNYLLTQTNVIAAVEAGREDLREVAGWLLGSVGPLFTQKTESFPFACEMRFLKRSEDSSVR